MSKIFSAKFKLNSKILAIIYICYKYKFPLSFMLSFYELYEDNALFIFKALNCSKKIKMNDNAFINALNESRLLYKQILKGVSDIEQNETPTINLKEFSNDYKLFIEEYLLKNIDNIYSSTVKFQFSTNDLYKEVN